MDLLSNIAAVTLWSRKKNFLREWDNLRPDMLSRERERPTRKSLKLNGHKRNARLRPERAVHCSTTTATLPVWCYNPRRVKDGPLSLADVCNWPAAQKIVTYFDPDSTYLEETTKCLYRYWWGRKKKKFFHMYIECYRVIQPLFSRWICFKCVR